MSLFKRGKYTATVLVQGTRHKLRMVHPSQSRVGMYEAICLDYNGTSYRAHAKAPTKAEADRMLAQKLGVLAPASPSKPRMAYLANSVVHVPASTFRGVAYPARTFVIGPELHEVCQFIGALHEVGEVHGSIRYIEPKPAVGKYSAKAGKWEISGDDILHEFWAACHGDLRGTEIAVVDKVRDVDTIHVTL